MSITFPHIGDGTYRHAGSGMEIRTERHDGVLQYAIYSPGRDLAFRDFRDAANSLALAKVYAGRLVTADADEISALHTFAAWVNTIPAGHMKIAVRWMSGGVGYDSHPYPITSDGVFRAVRDIQIGHRSISSAYAGTAYDSKGNGAGHMSRTGPNGTGAVWGWTVRPTIDNGKA